MARASIVFSIRGKRESLLIRQVVTTFYVITDHKLAYLKMITLLRPDVQ